MNMKEKKKIFHDDDDRDDPSDAISTTDSTEARLTRRH